MECIHRVNADLCPICAKPPVALESLSEERQSIIRYLEWVASVEVGSILGPDGRQAISWAAAWVRNELDRKPRE